MPDFAEMSRNGVSFTDPFHGQVWLSVTRGGSAADVTLAVSVARSWDTHILLPSKRAAEFADALGGSELFVVVAQTGDRAPAVLMTKGDRFAISILDDRLSDVFILGSALPLVAESLRAAAANP